MLRISAVSYLNTLPFVHGIKNSGFLRGEEYQMSLDIPSVCAARLSSGDANTGIVPVGALHELDSYRIPGGHCIAADGLVDSVLLVSQVPLEEIQYIMLDYHSRTSVELCRVLAERFWMTDPLYLPTGESYPQGIEGNTAGVLIGDRALTLRGNYAYVYDLAEEWKKFTGLPFVFALWVAIGEENKALEDKLAAALSWGVEHRADLFPVLKSANYNFDVSEYLAARISYKLDALKLKGMETFLSMQSTIREIKTA